MNGSFRCIYKGKKWYGYSQGILLQKEINCKKGGKFSVKSVKRLNTKEKGRCDKGEEVNF